MTRAEQPPVDSTAPDDALVADSRERAVRALLRVPQLKRLWGAQLIGGIGDMLALLVIVVLALQAAIQQGSFGGDYRGVALAVAAVFGARIIATLLFGAVLLGPLSSLTSAGGPLDRRWTMLAADGVRAALLIVAPLWIDWTPGNALALLLVTAFVTGVAERFWTICHEAAAPGLLPPPPPEGASVRPLPDRVDALRRLSLRTGFVAMPLGAAALVAVTLIGNLFGTGIEWFAEHQAALAAYVAAGLFAASLSVVGALELPDAETSRPRSPLQGLRRPRADSGTDKGRTGALPSLVLACGAVAGAVSAAVAVSVLHATDLGGGPVTLGLLVLGLTGGTVAGIRVAPSVLPALSRRRLLAFAIALTGVALLVAGLVPDLATVLAVVAIAGVAAGIAANTAHTLLDQEVEDFRRARTTAHLHAVVRVFVGVAALVAPVLAGVIGRHRLENGKFVFAHSGAAFTLMLAGALLLPVAALLLAKADDRSGVSLRRDLRDALRGADPEQAPAEKGFFIALEGGDGAGKSTQAQALADWVRAKGHEVVLTHEPGATPIGKRLRSILLDVSSAGLSHRAEALLYAADRAEHVDSVVRPALERGAVVISDRYIDSSVAYQGAGRDLSPTEVARISRWATGGLVPHLTVLLDVSPETARERFTEAPDRLESEPVEFHARVRSAFLTLAAAAPARYLVVDAGQEPEAVTTVIRHRLDTLLPLSDAEVKARDEARKAAEEEARRRAEEEAARKAEEERQERERQEQLARLRAEEEERKQRELEEAQHREAERQAEAARQRAEAARRRAEEEQARLLAEEAARAAEEERRRRQAEEESRLRAEAEAKRLEKQRQAEEALLRAEAARRAAEAAAGQAGGFRAPDNETTVPTPIVPDASRTPGSADETAVLPPTRDTRSPSEGPGGPSSEAEDTAVLPKPPVPPGAADETAVLPPVGDERPGGAYRTPGWAAPDSGAGGPADGTGDRTPPIHFRKDPDPAYFRKDPDPAYLRKDPDPSSAYGQPPSGADGAAAQRPQDAASHGAAPTGGLTGPNDRTRELPQVDPETSAPSAPRARPRPAWAEETPLDDLPSLADELLGPREDDDEGRGRYER